MSGEYEDRVPKEEREFKATDDRLSSTEDMLRGLPDKEKEGLFESFRNKPYFSFAELKQAVNGLELAGIKEVGGTAIYSMQDIRNMIDRVERAFDELLETGNNEPLRDAVSRVTRTLELRDKVDTLVSQERAIIIENNQTLDRELPNMDQTWKMQPGKGSHTNAPFYVELNSGKLIRSARTPNERLEEDKAYGTVSIDIKMLENLRNEMKIREEDKLTEQAREALTKTLKQRSSKK
jgi:hypothetical protein